MSIILTDSQGRRYRLTHGWGSLTCTNQNLFRGPGQAQAFVGQLAPEQTSEIFHVFFGGTDLLPRHLCTPEANATAISGPNVFSQVRTNNDRISDAIERSQLIIEKDDSLQPVADDRAILRVKIRQALNEILSAEKQEAARHQALLDQEGAVSKSLIYTGAAMTGLGKAAWGLLCFVKEASDLVNPIVRLQNRINALTVASRAEDKLETFITQLKKEEWREVVEVIGFDPAKITREQMAQAMDATSLIMDDATLASDLKTFSWNYIKAQHAIELTEAGGAAVFEIILTAVLAALTGGVGAIAATASKARHMTKFKKLGQLLVDFAKASKELAEHAREQAKRTAKSVKRSFDDVKTDAPAAERKAKPNSNSNLGFSYDSPKSVSYNDFKKSVKDFKNGGPDAEKAYDLFQQENWKELESMFNEKGLNGGWPPNGGAISTQKISLKPPKEIDRFGGFIDSNSGKFSDKGTFTAGLNEPFENRALPDSTKSKTFKKYKVVKEIPDVKAGKAIPWFDQKGKGMQYELPADVDTLVKEGYLEEII